jgi:hypothetical protein
MTTTSGTAEHWDEAYGHGDTTRSWFQHRAVVSLRMLDTAGVSPADSVIDVGGGASTLIDALVQRGHRDLTVLDLSAVGLRTAQERLGAAGEHVRWLLANVLTWEPERTYRVWHDRAVVHFLTTDASRQQYLHALNTATAPGAVAIIATFAPEGPKHCSGLPVDRYSTKELVTLLGECWVIVASEREDHATPSEAIQPFTWIACRRQ